MSPGRRVSASDPDLVEAIDSEREHLAHELHDVVLPLLFAASATLRQSIREIGDESELEARLSQAADWIDEAQREGRKLLVQLHPPKLDVEAWLVAAEHQVTTVVDASCEVIWEIQKDAPMAAADWDPAIASAAYRILGEAVRNAVRHGKAGRICVRADRHELSISDNGSGFDPDVRSPNRFGIRTMKRRAELVGCELIVESQPGGPTRVRLVFP